MATAPIPTPLPKSGAVSKGYNFASSWNQNAPLTALSLAVSERPFPANLPQEALGPENNFPVPAKDGFDYSRAMDAFLINIHQFYKWFMELETAMKSETEEKYSHYVRTLVECIGHATESMIKLITHLICLMNCNYDTKQFQQKRRLCMMRVTACYWKSRGLLNLQKHLEGSLTILMNWRMSWLCREAIRSDMGHFKYISSKFYSPNMKVGSANFLLLLKRLDECISYVEGNPQYAESSVYLVKFQHLQTRALGMIRSHVLSVLKIASSQVQAAIEGSGNTKTSISEGMEACILHVRFKAAAGELKFILEEMESRSSRKEYAQVLSKCHRLYCEQRLSLIRSIVHQRISEFAKKEGLASLTKSGCAYLMQVCQLEYKLFDHFFPSSSSDISSFALLIEPLCTYLYDTLLPKIFHETNLDILCELVGILEVKDLGEQLNKKMTH